MKQKIFLKFHGKIKIIFSISSTLVNLKWDDLADNFISKEIKELRSEILYISN